MKARANKLRDALTDIGHQLKYTESLEVISKVEGYADWNTYTAVLTKKQNIVKPYPLLFTQAAALKVKALIKEEGNPDLMLRVFVTGGSGSDFQYGFTFDEVINADDTEIKKEDVKLLIDPVSFQYLSGAEIDYTEGLKGSQFVIRNPNAKKSQTQMQAHARKLRDVLADMGHQLKHTESLEVIYKIEGYTDCNNYKTNLTKEPKFTEQYLEAKNTGNDSTAPAQSKTSAESETLYCSFCGKSQHEVRKLIAGPNVFICDACTDLCIGVIQKENKELAPVTRMEDQTQDVSDFMPNLKSIIREAQAKDTDDKDGV